MGIVALSRYVKYGTWKSGKKKKPFRLLDPTLFATLAFPMRVLIKYVTYAGRVTIHCLADHARIVVAPFKRVSSLETLYRLIAHVGGDHGNAERKFNKWGHGGCLGDREARTLRPARN